MRERRRKALKRQGHVVYRPEELERRMLLSTAIAVFGAQVTFGAGVHPRSVATADVNGDGKLDLVVANAGGNSLSVMLGNGNGSFGGQAVFSVGSSPYSVTTADVNRDGRVDLIASNNGGNSVSVLLGNGNGTFLAQQTFGAGNQARFVASGDVNGDGKPDVVVANYGAGTVSILLGNGNGSFGGQTTFAAGTQAASISISDLNRDGKLDLAVADKSANTVSVLLGNGNGSFGTRATFGAGNLPFSVVSADVNGDGKLDLVLAEESSNSVGVLLGNGNGTFGGQTTYGVGTVPAAVVVSDVNGDGKLDVAAANYSGNSVSVLLGNGNGNFAGQKTFGVGTAPFNIAAADVSRDGRVDLLVANGNVGGAGVLVGDVPPYVVSINRLNPSSQGTSATSVTYGVTFSEAVTGVDASDFALALSGVTATTPVVVSGSGASYSVTVNGISGTGTLGLNLVDNGSIHDLAGNPLQSGGFSLAPQQTFATGISPFGLAAADLNADGRLDVVTVNYFGTVSVLLGNGDGTFQSQQTYGVFGNGYSVAVADVNGDGRPDLVVAAGSVSVLLGNGDGTFQPQQTISGIPVPFCVTMGDLNGDGRTDMVVVSRNSSVTTVSVLLGNGDGTFQPRQTYAAGPGPWWVSEGDFNGDGRTDLVVAIGGGFPYPVGVFLGNGDGTFGAEKTFAAGGVQFVAVADVNGDGSQDVIGANPGFGQVVTLMGNGNGTFQASKTLGAGTSPYAIAVSDLDGDGRADILASNLGSDTVSVFVGNGDGTFKPQQTFSTGNAPDPVVVADVNRDGKPDVLVANRSSNNFSVLLGNPQATFTGQSYSILANVPPAVTSISRSSPAGPSATGRSVSYSVTFNEAVTGVDASDFQMVTTGGLSASAPLVVSGNGASYTVTINGISGAGTIQLNLVDDDSIQAGAGNPLGGIGATNGSFSGPSYIVLPADSAYPQLLSIARNGASTTGGSSVSYTVGFSVPVTGVDATDFALSLSGVKVTTPVVVSGGGATYTVTVNGISGIGTVGLNVVNNGSIKDSSGNPVQVVGNLELLAQQTIATGLETFLVAAGDLNGDGRSDLVVANRTFSVVTVMLGNGNGTFQPVQTFAAGINPYSLSISDLNGDGRPDLAIANSSTSNAVCVLLGNGDGKFGAPQTFSTGVLSNSSFVTDLNGDGKMDLVVTNGFDFDVSVLLGNGNGTFGPEQTFATGSQPRFVTSADLNGDGKPDLIVANYNASNVSILLGNGNGTFQAQQTFGTGAGPISVAVADLNRDGTLDLVVANHNGNTVSVLRGLGNGSFQGQQVFATGTGPRSLVTTDQNNDGIFDLAVDDDSGSIAVLVGNGDGTLQFARTFAVGLNPTSIAVSDFNGDGLPDLATANYGGNTVSVLMGNSFGTGTGPIYTITGANVNSITRSTPTNPTTALSSVSYLVNFDQSVTGVDASDFRVATTGTVVAAGPVTVTGGGTNYTITVNGVRGTGSLQLNLVDDNSIQGASGDLGGPGVGDGSFLGMSYLMAPAFPRPVSMVRTSPAGPSTSASSVSFTLTFTEAVVGVDATDFALNVTGNVTAITPVTVSGSGATYTLTVNGIAGSGTLGLTLLDDGTIRDPVGNPLQKLVGTFFQPSLTFAVGNKPEAVGSADFNGDGNADLVVANYSSSNVGVLLGNGNGTFTSQQTFAVTTYPSSVATGDVNGDGIQDVLTADHNFSRMSVLLGNGNGTFKPQRTLQTQLNPNSVGISDFNGDGKADLYVANLNSSSVTIQFGNGDGTFQSPRTLGVGGLPSGMTASDLNGDGRTDFVVTRELDGVAAVLLGNGNGTFSAPTTYAAPGLPEAVASTDVNGDGIPDLEIDEGNSGRVGVLLGNGDGTFKAQNTIFTYGGLDALAVADIDGDGRVDLINGAFNGNVAMVFGFGNGIFTARHVYSVGTNASSVAVADFNGDGRPDLVATNKYTNTVTVLQLLGTGGGPGQVYTVVPPPDTITGTSGSDSITLIRDINGTDIDWTLGASNGVISAGDPNGITINGNGGSDTVTLDYSHGNPLPNLLHLNGTFTISGLQGANPFSGTTVEIGQSTVYFSYAGGPNPLTQILAALNSGYNGGGWNGSGVGLAGAITSVAAASGPGGVYGVGYADSADGVVSSQPVNTVEIRYTVMGDTNLDRIVTSTDAITMARNYLIAGKTAWDLGNFNYDTTINLSDATILQKNFNASATGSIVAASAAAVNPAPGPAGSASLHSMQPLVAPSNAPLMSQGDGSSILDISQQKQKQKRHGRDARRN